MFIKNFMMLPAPRARIAHKIFSDWRTHKMAISFISAGACNRNSEDELTRAGYASRLENTIVQDSKANREQKKNC